MNSRGCSKIVSSDHGSENQILRSHSTSSPFAVGFILAIVALLPNCRERYQRCEPVLSFPSFTDYDVEPDRYTPRGIAVDTSGQAVSLEAIDALTDDVEACLARSFPGGEMTYTAWASASCTGPKWKLRRECITVKIAPDWFVGTSGDQLIPHGTGASCKQFAGPCFFRSVVQDSLTIVTTPDLKLFEAPLAQIALACQYPWSSAEVAACIRTPAAAGVTP
jgi:hypothetical protein